MSKVVQIQKIKCRYCGYEWIPRKNDNEISNMRSSRLCPKCHRIQLTIAEKVLINRLK